MLNASGFGFDNTTKRIIALDDVWKAWIGDNMPDLLQLLPAVNQVRVTLLAILSKQTPTMVLPASLMAVGLSLVVWGDKSEAEESLKEEC
ncbi:hypothetical protein AAC387_Pa02g1633 [Persea americana]